MLGTFKLLFSYTVLRGKIPCESSLCIFSTHLVPSCTMHWQAVLQNATLSLFAALYYNVNLMVLKKLC